MTAHAAMRIPAPISRVPSARSRRPLFAFGAACALADGSGAVACAGIPRSNARSRLQVALRPGGGGAEVQVERAAFTAFLRPVVGADVAGIDPVARVLCDRLRVL